MAHPLTTTALPVSIHTPAVIIHSSQTDRNIIRLSIYGVAQAADLPSLEDSGLLLCGNKTTVLYFF